MKTRALSFILFIIFLSINNKIIAGIGEWKAIAPFYGSKILCMAKHPNGEIFAATEYDGLYVSNDHGSNWKLFYSYHTTTVLGSIPLIAIDSSGTIYIDIDQYGIQKSTDEGKTWINVNFSPYASEGVFSITTDKAGNIYIGTQYGLYISNDKGITWVKILDTTYYFRVRKIYFKDDIIFALVDQSGIFKSKDHGQTWTIISLPDALSYGSMLVISENEFYVAMSSPPLPYLTSGLYKTTDGGDSWNQLTNGLTTSFLNEITAGKNNRLYAGGILGRIYKSDDSGASWQVLTGGMSAGTVNSILFDGNRIITGNSLGGIIITDDDGNTWKYSNTGFNIVNIRAIEKLEDGSFLIANDAGLFHYISTGDEFIGLNNFPVESRPDIFGDLSSVEINGIIQNNINSYLIVTYQGLILQTYDQGKSWQPVNMQYRPVGITLIEKTKTGRIYFNAICNDNGLFKSDDNGITWKKEELFINNCRSITDDTKGNLLASSLTSLYYSTDDGNSWNTNKDFPSQISDMKLVSDGVYYLLTIGNGLFRSSDNGVNWSNIISRSQLGSLNLPDLPGNQITEIQKDNLLLATNQGFYESIDNGQNWNKRNDNLSNSNISTVNITDEGLLYAVTDNGIYVSSNSITSVTKNDIPAQFQLQQNYPNPFNPKTIINFSIPQAGFVTIKIYDILGKEVATIINENKNAGYYKVNFDASSLTSGVYIYRITSNNFVQAKKMLLMK